MKKFEKGSDKVNEICDILRQEALEPAKKEGQQIIDDANKRAEQIIQSAEKQAEKLLAENRRTIDQEKSVFQSSLAQSAKQSLEALRQSIESNLFNEELSSILQKATVDPAIIAKMVNAICTAIEKEGTSTNLSAVIPKTVSAADVVKLLLQNVAKRLSENKMVLGDISGGAQVKLVDKSIMIDMTDEALRELLMRYVRKDFRQLIFGNGV